VNPPNFQARVSQAFDLRAAKPINQHPTGSLNSLLLNWACAALKGAGAADGVRDVQDEQILKSFIGGEYFRFDEASRTLTGDQSGTVYASGQKLPLRLAEANPVSGALRFEMVEGRGLRDEA
jgi:hypothetical protein